MASKSHTTTNFSLLSRAVYWLHHSNPASIVLLWMPEKRENWVPNFTPFLCHFLAQSSMHTHATIGIENFPFLRGWQIRRRRKAQKIDETEVHTMYQIRLSFIQPNKNATRSIDFQSKYNLRCRGDLLCVCTYNAGEWSIFVRMSVYWGKKQQENIQPNMLLTFSSLSPSLSFAPFSLCFLLLAACLCCVQNGKWQIWRRISLNGNQTCSI